MKHTPLYIIILYLITLTLHAQSYKSISIDVIDIAFDQEIDVLYEWQRGSGGKTFYVESEYDPKISRIFRPFMSAEQPYTYSIISAKGGITKYFKKKKGKKRNSLSSSEVDYSLYKGWYGSLGVSYRLLYNYEGIDRGNTSQYGIPFEIGYRYSFGDQWFVQIGLDYGFYYAKVKNLIFDPELNLRAGYAF